MRRILAIFFSVAMASWLPAQLADGYLQTWLTQRTEQLEYRFSARPFDSIGWADSLVHAAEVAKKNDRPIFLFTLDGHMNTGRC